MGQPGGPVEGQQALPSVLAMDGWGRLATGGNGAALNGGGVGGAAVGQVNGAANGYHGVAAVSVQPIELGTAGNGAEAGSGLRKAALAGIALGVAAGAVLKWRGGGALLRASTEAMQHLPEAARIAGLNQGFAESELASQLPVDAWRKRLADFIAPAPPPPPEPWHRRAWKRLSGFSSRYLG